MPTFQHSELLPGHEILQYKIPTATEEANQCSDPEEKQAEHGTELYQINDWKYCCKLLILRSARVLARDKDEEQTRAMSKRENCRECRFPRVQRVVRFCCSIPRLLLLFPERVLLPDTG